jgi:hypothetical protein
MSMILVPTVITGRVSNEIWLRCLAPERAAFSAILDDQGLQDTYTMRCAIRNASYLAAHCGVTHLADPVRPRQPSVEFAVVGPGTAALVGGKKFILHAETTQKD